MFLAYLIITKEAQGVLAATSASPISVAKSDRAVPSTSFEQ